MLKSLLRHFDGTGLKARCARGGSILAVGTFADRGLAFLSKMIIVRVLIPAEMGLMVLVLSLTAMFEVFTEVGIKQSVIQHKNGAAEDYLNMAWWFQAIRSIVIYIIAFLIAPWVCEFYFASKADVLARHEMSELVWLVRTAFLSIIFNGLVSPAAYALEKHFRFGRAMIIVQGSDLIGTAVSILLVFILRSAWAMVIGFCSMYFFRCLFSYILCDFRPSFAFDRDSFRDLFKYAKGVFGSPIFAYFALHFDVLVGGRLVGADLLGMYGMAVLLARVPQELFTRVINPLLLPAFAEQQDTPEVLSRTILKITKVTALIAVPLTTLSVLFSEEIMSIVFGETYARMAPAFALLCIYILISLKARILSNLFFGIGRPDKHRIFVVVRLAILAVLMYPAIKMYGMTGAAFVLVIANLIALGLQVILLDRFLNIKIADYTNCWEGGVMAGLAIMVVFVFFRIIPPAISLVSQIFKGAY